MLNTVKRILPTRVGWTDEQLRVEFRMSMQEARTIREQLVAEGLLAAKVDRYNRHLVLK